MRKSIISKRLSKPVHIPVKSAIFAGGTIVAIALLGAVFGQQSRLSLTRENTQRPQPTPTSVLAQKPSRISPTLLPTKNWITYHNWKFHYSVSVPPEFVPNTQFYTLDQVLNSPSMGFIPKDIQHLGYQDTSGWEKQYAFTFSLGYGTNGTHSILAKCSASQMSNQFSHEQGTGINPFPIYGRILGKQVQGAGWLVSQIHQYYFEYPLCIEGNYFHIEFDFQGLTAKQILDKRSIIDTILSTITFDD
jgi:hypothetical protein